MKYRNEVLARQKYKNYAMFVIIASLAVLFYALTIVKMI